MMADLYTSGRLVEIILLLVLLEVAAIVLHRQRTGRGLLLADLLPNALAGAFLLLALRVSLGGSGWIPVSASLAAAGIAHAVDIGRRWQRRP